MHQNQMRNALVQMKHDRKAKSRLKDEQIKAIDQEDGELFDQIQKQDSNA